MKYWNKEFRVLQWSVLYPSIFLYYINDIPVGLNFTIWLFVDYTTECMAIKYTKMHNICNKISTILQYRKENRVSGTQINV
jgi:hypothetical protein